MNKTLKFFGILGMAALVSGCTDGKKIINFEGIPADVTVGIYNPGRGFRLETAVDLVDNRNNPTELLDSLSEAYVSDSVSLTQCYFYLTNLIGKDLSEENMRTMQAYFDEMRRLGKKAVLRFAYERDFMGRSPKGPTEEQVLRQVEQLKPFLQKNKDLILAVQAGLIGAWGEWHSSIHGLEKSEETKRRILEKLLSVVPEELDVQVRLPEYKDLVKDKAELYRRVSFHNDFIVVKPDPWDGGLHEGTESFARMVKESPYVAVDGELPWGFWSVGSDPDSPTAGWLIEGLPAARELFLNHYTSLSIIHNYKEQHPNNRFDTDNPPEYSMVVWKKTMVPEDSVRKYGLPVSDNYFRTARGEAVKRSMFDYIRDHLGYRVELQKLELPSVWKSGREVKLNLELINRGFATVFGNHFVSWALIGEDGDVTVFRTDCNPSDWQPYSPSDTAYTPLTHRISSELTLPETLDKGIYRLGLWVGDASERLLCDPRFAIRFANGNISWWTDKEGRYGINLLTDIKVE